MLTNHQHLDDKDRESESASPPPSTSLPTRSMLLVLVVAAARAVVENLPEEPSAPPLLEVSMGCGKQRGCVGLAAAPRSEITD